MSFQWELYESGPADAERVALLLPGGLLRARSYEELTREPALDGVRLVAATLPGHAGTRAPDDFGIEHAARLASELASEIHADVVLGFSMGATVALEMVLSRQFSGPAVLCGISLSLEDEAMFLRVFAKLSGALGSLPFAMMRQMAGSMTKQLDLTDARRTEIREDLLRNDPKAMREIFRGYLRYLQQSRTPAARLCDSGVPAWVVHAEEKGDGGLTDEERATLQACPAVTVETIPGSSFLLPSEEPELVAKLLSAALLQR